MTPTRVTRVQTWRQVPQGARPRNAVRPVDPRDGFADHVRATLDGPVLRYSQRLTLLKDAQRRGLGRFEANLVIASVLHAQGLGQEYELRPRAGWMPAVITVITVQMLIAASCWWLLR
jgi:hypothetical protein